MAWYRGQVHLRVTRPVMGYRRDRVCGHATAMILNRKDLGEETLGVFFGALLIGAGFCFRSEIESRIGQTTTRWILNTVLLIYALHAIPVIGGLLEAICLAGAACATNRRSVRAPAG